MKIYAPWEKTFQKVATPLEHFIHAQTTTGIILVFMTIVALILANTPLYEFYENVFHLKISFNVSDWKLSHTIHHWINDGLMAIFFFLIGLEIKRNILVGELSNVRVAILPILAALGGMVVPAAIYIYVNSGLDSQNGWGIPMATDIAFAISALVLLNKRVSPSLVTFLIALAIVDDLGAVVVIAVFYTEQIHLAPLILAGASFLIMVSFNRFGIHAVLPYFLVGMFLWFFMLESGVHATIAGVIAAMAIPSKPKYTPDDFSHHIKNNLDEYDSYPVATDYSLHEKQKALLINMSEKIDSIQSPSARLEQVLHLPVSLLVIPLFALANAGISINFSKVDEALMEPISLGIILGLVFGKVLGIAGVSYIATKLKIAQLPDNSSMSQVFGVSLLGGIGFTMSIFVAELAFYGNEPYIFQAKIAILTASLLAGLSGYLWLRFIAQKPHPDRNGN
ncbi:Na+/H+ antiporter NhaA [Sulfurimonas sp. C5]|uniref:Na+/H+ antiporter NhaA n=1 Tax=Sulfurimonas sp. C5 TaxID=3036947 RepID=UPI002456881F|nr:Na+/H+ antiporter NhaA [Sulfurimonas sp. C5]MDH4945250.1 Na+/H+ antiporter NhaA [Sulfurimonas sp. C5]